MHWTLADLRALSRLEYSALIEWLNEQQQKQRRTAEAIEWP